MTGQEIVESALLREKTERLSCFPLIDVAYAGGHVKKPVSRLELDPEAHAEALTACIDELPVDGVYINLCFDAKQAAKAKLTEGYYKLWIDDAIEINIPENDVAAISNTQIKSLDDERMETAQLFHPGILATFRTIGKEIREVAAVVVGLTGAFSQVAFLYGIENLMMAMIDEPAAVKRAIEKRQKIAIAQAEDICRAGARFIWIGEGVASGSIISPAMYCEFVLPFEQELAEEIRRMGALSLLHICGNTSAFLAEIAECRADGYDVDYLVDLRTAIDVMSPRISIKGNINPTLFLPGKVEELSKACNAAVEVGREVAGFIMSTGCLVPRDSCREAFSIMAKACDLNQSSN